jgi:hypothetical protein
LIFWDSMLISTASIIHPTNARNPADHLTYVCDLITSGLCTMNSPVHNNYYYYDLYRVQTTECVRTSYLRLSDHPFIKTSSLHHSI